VSESVLDREQRSAKLDEEFTQLQNNSQNLSADNITEFINKAAKFHRMDLATKVKIYLFKYDLYYSHRIPEIYSLFTTAVNSRSLRHSSSARA
jgi:hypothetical protein